MINTENIPNWERLQKALLVEAESGFSDLMGNRYRFSEFICLSLNQQPPVNSSPESHRWQEIATEFANYPHLSLDKRKTLIADTQEFLNQLKAIVEKSIEEESKSKLSLSKPSEEIIEGDCDFELDSLLKEIPQIGSRKSIFLERLSLYKAKDLLTYYPRDHIDYARQVKIGDLIPGETVTIVGKVYRCSCFSVKNKKHLTILSIQIQDKTGKINLSRFLIGYQFSNRGYQEKIKNQYPRNSIIAASGLVKENKYGLTIDNPEIEILDREGDSINSLNIGRILPVYPLTEGVAADLVRKSVIEVLPLAKKIIDPLPDFFRNQYGLIGLSEAIPWIHFPPDSESLTHARRRLVFDEFFYLQLGFLQRRQQQRHTQQSAVFAPRGELIQQFIEMLPFKLTNAQDRVIGEIYQDLEKETPMNRLVQGDVGSGKTIVAVMAILAGIQSGYQSALMAPTEVLAEQHYRKLVNWFNLLQLPVEILTGSTKIGKRRKIHEQLETGQLPLLVGTHALIQDKVNFKNLGLVVIDEQHRFGVEQRARLLAKGKAPHVLTMTATPIPRTLALTLHGDLDVSQIDELPPGRQAIHTTVLGSAQRTQAYELIRREVAQGRQAYIIYSLIEESQKLNARAAVAEYERISETIFPEFTIGLLHGRLKSDEKDQVLSDFRENKNQIIISTTVIEVGVDVPNATVMMIENAERFGLSQLHQLRGRIGRGEYKSFCLLVSNSQTEDSMQRLQVLAESQDGFFISEMDLQLRGPGQFLGSRQSGLPDFALASLAEDGEVLNLAREAAEKIIQADETLDSLPSLKEKLEERIQGLLGKEILT